MEYFEYGSKEKEYLSKRDPVIRDLIEKYGHIQREINPDPFSALVGSIISQQISTKAAETVEARLLVKAGELSPDKLWRMSEEEIQECGLSFRKAGYIKGIAQAAVEGKVDFEGLREMENHEIVESLVCLKGVGKWTAEMMLIFSYQRMDVLSFDDLGIRRGLSRAYGLEEIRKEQHDRFRELFSPYGTVASLYIWEESSNKE
ncbi:MAG: DNA-3-methyladenine glycosylase family protein [Bacillota bacterium]